MDDTVMSINRVIQRLTAGTLVLAMLLLSACGSKSDSGDDKGQAQNSASTTAPSDHTTVAPPKAEHETSPALTISELMTRNTAGITDEYGNYSAWIELRNLTDKALSLSGYTLEHNGRQYVLPNSTVEANGYVVFFANGKGGGTNCSFTLASSGALTLWHGEKIACQIEYVNRNMNYSFVVETGAESAQPTPGYAEVKAADRLVISELVSNNSVTPIDGALDDYVELYNDGSEPIDLSEYYASEKADDLYDTPMPAKVIAPGEYLVLVCDKDLPFGFSKDGGVLYITRNDGVLAASATYTAMSGGQVYTYDRGIIEEASPGYPNTYAGMCASIVSRTGLVINEVITSNGSYMKLNGEAYDVVELWNNSDSAVNLSDYYFSDSKNELQRYHLPDVTLEAGAHYTFRCTGGAKIDGSAHISLSAEGEKIFLSKADGTIVDALSLPALPYNVSYGRGSTMLYYYASPTPGKSNGSSGCASIANAPAPTLGAGFYVGAQSVKLSGEGTIYYTTDGSRPTTSSKVYYGETINITETTAIRTFAVVDGKITSPIANYNYLIDTPDYTLPVMKISVKDDDMYGTSGIYSNPNSRAEKECSAAFFVDGKEEFSVSCGIEISGASSRQYSKKSFQLKFKAKYGTSKLYYKMFDNLAFEEYDSLVLRSGSQGMMSYRCFFNDELVTSLANYGGEMPEVLAQDYRPCNLYINDEYYGIYFIREKISDDFVAQHYDVSPESVTIIQFIDWLRYGSSTKEWKELYNFICKNDMADHENYQQAANQISLESLIDVYIMRLWASDRDSGNIRTFKSTEGDGKWRFILFDCDISFEPSVKNGSANYLFASSKGDAIHGIIRSLMDNKEFRALFLSRVEKHFAHTVSSEVALARINTMVAEIEHDMQYNTARWPEYHSSTAAWLKKINTWKETYVVPEYYDNLRQQLITVLGLTADEVRTAFGEEYVQYCTE